MIIRSTLAAILLAVVSSSALGDDWPTYRNDIQRSGVTQAKITLPLEPSWKRISPTLPKTAWARPAKWDAYSGNEGLQAMRNFDGAFYVTVAGGMVYFSSSIDDAVHCLDAATGEEKWVAFAGAPVRLPPTIVEKKAYFGSDDGFAYCVDAKTGNEIWKVRAAPSARLIPSDGRMISPWPVRTGVLVRNNTAYFGASLLPWRDSLLYGVDAASGKVEGEGRFRQIVKDVTLQGMMLANQEHLIVPQGRAQVLKFNSNGKSGGQFSDAGGVHCAITTAAEEQFLVSGPRNQKARENVFMISGVADGKSACNAGNAVTGVASEGVLFTNNGTKLTAIDLKQRADLQRRATFLKRKAAKGITPEEKEEYKAIPAKITKTQLWEVEAAPAFEMIIIGEFVVLGTPGGIRFHRRDIGELIWEAKVEGNVLGLAYADGRLYASTDLGHIYTFTGP